MHLVTAILYLSRLSGIAPVITGARVRNSLWYYSILSLLADANGVLFDLKQLALPREYRLWHANFYFAGEFLLLSFFLINQLNSNASRLRVWPWSVLVVTGFGVHCSIAGNWWHPDYLGGAVLYSLLVLLCVLGFHHILHREQPLRLERSPFFIVAAAVLLFTAGSFLQMVLATRHTTIIRQLWIVHNVLNIFKNLAIAYALYLYRMHPSSRESIR